MQANKPRLQKLGDKAQTKVNRTHWRAFSETCDVFRELVTKLESGSIINAASESGGSDNGAAPSQIDFKIDFELALRRVFDEHERREFYVWLFLNNEKGAEQYAILGQEFLRRGLYPLGRYFAPTTGWNEQSQAVKKALKPRPFRTVKPKPLEAEVEVEQQYVTQQYETIAEDEIFAFEHQHGFSFEDFEAACD